ncbi:MULTISPECIES: tail fiber assembly protein [unclassified Pseudocitrobacter]|uniref:tail fiber assembly protein n=1 Tax=unclassified Pseudocitrobacter TaxID=2638778 RepID=UPI0023E3DCCA|nr:MULTISPECIES: tail fiber assembly protein [unclassified Pseudocitrobacter]MDF3826897.1 tail fiber assembly protein [Pseudocitrobacter sp. 2023EL-00150]MEC5375669.1 tail fiber assembly protein [Pseudocitrobacter sp. MW920760]
MKNKNFTAYTRSGDNPHNIAYLRDEDGNDWYENQADFKSGTLKIAYDALGIIRSLTYNVELLFPVGLSVAEINNVAVPDGISINGQWKYNGKKIIQMPVDYIAIADAEKTRRIQAVTEAIAPLQDAVDLDIATDQERASLLALKKARVLLNRVDTSDAPDIEWPEVPCDVA